MTTTQTTYETQPLPEPVYTTKGDIERATLAVYRTWRAQGWSEGSAEQSAAEFYAYQIVRLELRRLEEARSLETVCAWCSTHISGVVGADAEHTSHGICASCAENMETEVVRA